MAFILHLCTRASNEVGVYLLLHFMHKHKHKHKQSFLSALLNLPSLARHSLVVAASLRTYLMDFVLGTE